MSYKYYNNKTFDLGDGIDITCETQDTRYGFRHVATMTIRSGEGYNYKRDTYTAKCCYYNRTWESYTYQSVIHKVIDNAKLSNYADLIRKADAIGDRHSASMFSSIAMIAKMGELLTDTQSQANDWKARMLKAGIGEALDMPSDWSTLSEDEKQSRLDKAIQALA